MISKRLFKHRISALVGLGLLAVHVCVGQGLHSTQPTSGANVSNSAASNLPTSTSAPAPAFTTVLSTITTTLTHGQALPTSLPASASSSGSVWYIPVSTAIPVSSNASSTPPSPSASNASPTANATSLARDRSVNSALPLHTTIDPAFGVLGALLFLTGLPMAFYGHRNRWSSYFLSGFFTLALVCICIILKVGVERATDPPSKAIRGLFLVAAVIAGAIGGVISIVFWRGAGLFTCGLGGFFFGLFLQAVRPGGLIRPTGLRYILYIGLYAALFAISCIERAHSLVLALATAIIGATAVTLAIDCYSTQGLKEFYVRNLGFDALFSSKCPPTFLDGRFPLVQGMQIELGVLGALILMGFAFQMRLWSDLQTQLSALKRSDERRNMRSKAERAARAVARTAKRDLEEWEARHGYKKTASRPTATDEESGPQAAATPDLKDAGSRTSSFMTLFRANTDVTQLATPTSQTEKLTESPAALSLLENVAYPFPAQTNGRRSSHFLEYIQKGTERGGSEGPLKLNLPTTDTPLAEFQADSPAPASMAPTPSSPLASLQPKSLDLARTASMDRLESTDSFRRRSASTAALMNNSASFLDPSPSQTEPDIAASNSNSAGTEQASHTGIAPEYSGSSDIAPGPCSAADATDRTKPPELESKVRERTISSPSAPAASLDMAASTLTAKRLSHQTRLQHSFNALSVEPNAGERQAQTQQSPVSSPPFAPVKTVSGGQSSAAVQARRSLAMRRNDQPTVPWTNPGAEMGDSAHRRGLSAEAQLRTRVMSIEELEARHRAKLAALQAPATQTVNEADALRKAKEEWERKQSSERRRMQEREAQKQAAAAAATSTAVGGSAATSRVASPIQGSHDMRRFSSSSRDERRRSRALSATLLEAVGEETREVGGVNRAAEWRKSIAGLEQLDPRAATASTPATSSGTRPTSLQPTSRLEQMSANPFPPQTPSSRRRLSETDRRRLSQGAGERVQRRQSQPLLDFGLPHRDQ